MCICKLYIKLELIIRYLSCTIHYKYYVYCNINTVFITNARTYLSNILGTQYIKYKLKL